MFVCTILLSFRVTARLPKPDGSADGGQVYLHGRSIRHVNHVLLNAEKVPRHLMSGDKSRHGMYGINPDIKCAGQVAWKDRKVVRLKILLLF